MSIQHPKVVVIGAGSLFFGREAIWQMVYSSYLNKGTLGLVDIDNVRLEKMHKLAEMVVAHTGVQLKVEASVDRTKVLSGADFVVLTFADRSAMFRGIDCQISEKYGIRMCSGDTIGPGGIFRSLREIPQVLACACDIERLCPDAWVINYVNPTAVMGIALKRHAPHIKSFALCDGLHMPYVKRGYAKRAGIIKTETEYTPQIDAKFDLRIAGVNHFTWMIKAEYEGRDVTPQIAEAIRKVAATETDGGDTGAKGYFNATIGYALYEAFGYIPTCVGHTKEYVRFWQGIGRTAENIPPLKIWEVNERYTRHAEMWQQIDDFLSGKIPISEYMKKFKPDHATDVIESMVGNLKKPFYINTFNDGAVTNMAKDAFLELCCDVDIKNGPLPRPVGVMPRGIRGMQELVLDTHELTVEAAVTCDRRLLRRAMLTDPLTNSIGDADTIIKELLEAEKEVLPPEWFK